MILIVTFLLAIGLAGATAARLTRLRPMAIAAIGGVPGGALGLVVAAGAMSSGPWGFAVIAYLSTAAITALGAFLGWLRRDNLKRKH